MDGAIIIPMDSRESNPYIVLGNLRHKMAVRVCGRAYVWRGGHGRVERCPISRKRSGSVTG